MINDTAQTVTVEGFHQASMALNEVKIATIAVAYDCPTTFRTYILFFFQCLYIPTLDFHLVNPLLQIPLSLRGTMSGFTTRIPSQEEIDDLHGTICHHVHMTAEAPWDPHDKTHRRLEDSLRADISSDYELRVLESRDIYPLQVRGQNAETVEMTVETVDSDDEDDEDEPCPVGVPLGPSDFIDSEDEY